MYISYIVYCLQIGLFVLGHVIMNVLNLIISFFFFFSSIISTLFSKNSINLSNLFSVLDSFVLDSSGLDSFVLDSFVLD